MSLKDEAKMLRARAADVQRLPMWDRATAAGYLVEDVSAFLERLAARVDALTPFIDETDGGANG